MFHDFRNNVALAKTARPFTGNSGNIGLVILATPSAVLLSNFNWTLLTLGFGELRNLKKSEEDVLQAGLVEIDHKTQDEFQSISYKARGKDYVNYVDAGGPAVDFNGMQFGITSLVRKQRGGSFVIVYERVDKHVEFIQRLCPKTQFWKPATKVAANSSISLALEIVTVNVTIGIVIGFFCTY